MAKAASMVVVDEKTTNLPAEVYDYGQYAGAGSDQIDNADVSIPRLKLIQAMSPEAKELKTAEEGDLVHSITGEVLIKKGSRGLFIPILYQKEYVLWRDRKNGGGIMARARKVQVAGAGIRYKWDKPNQMFEDKLEGKLSVKYQTAEYIEDDGLASWGSQIPGDAESGPAATETHNFIVALPEHDYQLIAITLARTAAKKAKDLNFMIKTAMNTGAPMFALKFSVGTVMEKGDDNTWANYAFQSAGKVAPNDSMFSTLAEMFKGFASRSFVIHDADVDDGPNKADRSSGTEENGKF